MNVPQIPAMKIFNELCPRTAEVTLGGIDTDELSSKTMQCKRQPGLYCIGEVVDVTGHLGGFNFQWGWSSAQAAGSVI